MEEYNGLISAASEQYGLDPAVLKGLIYQESHFNKDAVSPKGAIGIAQFMPKTAEGIGIDPRDPEQAIFGAAYF